MDVTSNDYRKPSLVFTNHPHDEKHSTVFSKLSAIRSELRERRKLFLGSNISLQSFLYDGPSISDDAVKALSRYLADRTVLLWETDLPFADELCVSFYQLALHGISGGEVGNESVDDIIQLAECLVRSKDVFVTVMKNILPDDMISALFHFTDTYDSSCFTAYFEDAVLGAVSVFLGRLTDPVAAQADTAHEED